MCLLTRWINATLFVYIFPHQHTFYYFLLIKLVNQPSFKGIRTWAKQEFCSTQWQRLQKKGNTNMTKYDNVENNICSKTTIKWSCVVVLLLLYSLNDQMSRDCSYYCTISRSILRDLQITVYISLTNKTVCLSCINV